MRIIRLRFKNLNSLYGEWTIDFTHPAYRSEGLFAITGPTGSGKSTLLDAICLALYGETPRLGRISKGSNDIMSRRTGECFAEVTFSNNSGTFRCFWHQHRARRNPDGNLVDAVHEIADVRTGQVLETKKRSVAAVVEEITGMNFRRFTRSTLLAQGDFAAFLDASANERAPVLEQITGTEIYSDISIGVHERHRREEEELEKIQIELNVLPVQPPEELKRLRQKQSELTDALQEVEQKLEVITDALLWHKTVKSLQERHQAAGLKFEKSGQALADFAGEQRRLQRSWQALEIESTYAAFLDLSVQQKVDQTELGRTRLELAELKKNLSDNETKVKQAEQTLLKQREKLKKSMPAVDEAKALDLTITQYRERLQDLAAAIKKQLQVFQRERKRQKDAICQLHQLMADKDSTTNKLARYGPDEQFKEKLERFLGGREQFRHTEKELEAVEIELSATRKIQATADRKKEIWRDELRQLEDKQKALNKEAGERQKELNVLLSEATLQDLLERRADCDLELARREKYSSLAEERKNLKPGLPCPLCGSFEHPFLKEVLPRPSALAAQLADLKAQIEQAEQYIDQIRSLEKEEAAVVKRIADNQAEQIRETEALKPVTDKLQQLQLNRGQLDEKRQLFKNLVDELVSLFCFTKVSRQNFNSLDEALAEFAGEFQTAKERLLQLDQDVIEVNLQIKEIETAIKAKIEQLRDLYRQQRDLNKTKQAATSKRTDLVGTCDPRQIETELNETLELAQKALERCKNEHNQVQNAVFVSENMLKTLRERIDGRGKDLDIKKSLFEQDLQAGGFTDEQDFFKSRLSAEQRQALHKQDQKINQDYTESRVQLAKIQEELAAEQAKAVTDQSEDKLTEEKTSLEKSFREIHLDLAASHKELQEQATIAIRYNELKKRQEKQQAVCHSWLGLHNLIGSADGKKYRNFAQGLSFEQLIRQANRQLMRMTDRYLLVRATDKQLELNVIDQYQADEIRTTRNLSGGERFLVSLALALGLSKMSGQKARIDSLFLDEGFGALDSQSLEQALSALTALNREGQLIGLISHVPAIQERIPVQLELKAVAGGRSVLKGPGVR